MYKLTIYHIITTKNIVEEFHFSVDSALLKIIEICVDTGCGKISTEYGYYISELHPKELSKAEKVLVDTYRNLVTPFTQEFL